MKKQLTFRFLAMVSILFAGSFLMNSYASVVTDGLVAFYPFNGNANDESVNGYDGTVYGATPIADRFGTDASAYEFNDSNGDSIDLPAETLDFERTDAFSIALWVKSTSTGRSHNFLAKMTQSTVGMNMVMHEGYFRFLLSHQSGVGNRLFVRSSSIINDGEWHHLVVTHDGTSSAAGVKLYIDGATEPMFVYEDTLTDSILTDVTPTIGSRNNNYNYKGAVDDLFIYNRELSASEAMSLAAIPEPASIVMIGLASGACYFVRRRFL